MIKQRMLTKSPKVSVIIPVYNAEQHLCECLDSVKKQTLRNIEIICVDDGSSDSSLHILEEYADKDKRIKLLRQENKGAGLARNRGIIAANGEFIAFMDADDFYPEHDILSILYNTAIKNNVWICGGEFSLYFGDKNKLKQNFDGTFSGYLFDKNRMMDYRDYQFDYGYHRFIYNRDFLLNNKIFFPPYRRYQDPPFFVKAMITAGNFYAIDKITYGYRCAHKNVEWNAQKVTDLLDGLHDDFIMAKKYDLSGLGELTYHRFEQHYPHIKEVLAELPVKKLRKLAKYDTKLQAFLLQDNLLPPRINWSAWRQKLKSIFIKEKKNDPQVEQHLRVVKLFFLLPLYKWEQYGGKETWSILWLPIFKRRRFANGVTTKYYILGVPVMKVSRKMV